MHRGLARGHALGRALSGAPEPPERARSASSKMSMPASIAATNASALILPAPSATSAGPGQKPASPQPTPNARLPSTSLASIPRAVGSAIGAPSHVDARLPAMAKATAPIATAPAMTSASEGSQAPARSRNPRIFAGLIIPETTSPTPKTRPATNELNAYIPPSHSDDVPHDVHRREAGRHERQRGDERARRNARNSAHAVPARATGAIAGADADQQSGNDQRRIASVDHDRRQGRGQHV